MDTGVGPIIRRFGPTSKRKCGLMPERDVEDQLSLVKGLDYEEVVRLMTDIDEQEPTDLYDITQREIDEARDDE